MWRKNLRYRVGQYPTDPEDLIFPFSTCLETELGVELPLFQRYNCSQPRFGAFVSIESFGDNFEGKQINCEKDGFTFYVPRGQVVGSDAFH